MSMFDAYFPLAHRFVSSLHTTQHRTQHRDAMQVYIVGNFHLNVGINNFCAGEGQFRIATRQQR